MTRSTLETAVSLSGNAVRLHGGLVTMTLAPGDEGFVFVRDDTGRHYSADLAHLVPVPNCTALGDGGEPQVLFTEHVLSALVGLGYTDAEIHLDGAEVPLLDGSALPVVESLRAAGRIELGELEPLRLSDAVTLDLNGKRLVCEPADDFSVDYSFEHPHPLLGRDEVVFAAGADYAAEIAPARTFATAEEIEALRARGLVKGGSEANIVIVYADRLSSPRRLTHELAAHKVLDLIGDLALLGRPLLGHITAVRTGHADNQALAARIAAG